MEKSEFLVESPPKPARKVRRKALTKRERGIQVACSDGQFVMPREPAGTTPLVRGIRELSLAVYNEIADLLVLKVEFQGDLLVADAESGLVLQRAITLLNKRIGRLKKLGYNQREYILEVEGGKPLNEPREWVRI